MISEKLMSCLPRSVSEAVLKYNGDDINEIRIHAGRFTSLTTSKGNYLTNVICSENDIRETVDEICGGSLHAYSETVRRGYIPFDGGVRIGVCGSVSGGAVRDITSLCIRIPRSVSGVGRSLCKQLIRVGGGMLIYSPPGEGKTTLLRDIAICLSTPPYQRRVAVIDSRGEIYRQNDFRYSIADIYLHYDKADGIELATRTMSPQYIVCDELGSEDAFAVLSAQNCGVPLIASAHADRLEGLLLRPAFAELDRAGVFSSYVGIKRQGQGFCFDISEKEAVGGIK